ncbi:MAG: tryptophan--tRNA ligase [Candidatus Paceibacterota bacterium]
MTKPRILSGMRPTGKLHLGHLIGALDNWVQLQDKYDCFYMVADWHALMSEYQDPANIRKYSLDNVLDWIACGIDPKKSVIFLQSDIPEHLELHIILSVITPLGWLERCPTYKEQLEELKAKDIMTYGFLGYPVLQAADILIYKANAVPVGEDQLPHLELTREITRKFNNLYCVNKNKAPLFPEPEAKLTRFPRLLGMDRRKMSKSYENAINLSDSPQEIKKKTQSMFTDPKRLRKTDPGHPSECNVYNYYNAFKAPNVDQIASDCHQAKIGCTDCKANLSDFLLGILKPLQDKRNELMKDPDYVRKVLDEGGQKAKAIASATMKDVRKLLMLK